MNEGGRFTMIAIGFIHYSTRGEMRRPDCLYTDCRKIAQAASGVPIYLQKKK